MGDYPMFEVKVVSGIAQKSVAFEHSLRLRAPRKINEMLLARDDLPGPAVSRTLEIEAGRRFGLQLGVVRLQRRRSAALSQPLKKTNETSGSTD